MESQSSLQSLQKKLEKKDEDINYLTSVLRQLKQKINNQKDNTDGFDTSTSKGDQFAYINNRLQEISKKYRELHSGLLRKFVLFFGVITFTIITINTFIFVFQDDPIEKIKR